MTDIIPAQPALETPTGQSPVSRVMSERVCDCCHLVVANGEGCQCSGHSPMSKLPGWWYSAGHGVGDEECPDCKQETGDWCDRASYESSPSWECPGCGNQPGMFFDMHLIERQPDGQTHPR